MQERFTLKIEGLILSNQIMIYPFKKRLFVLFYLNVILSQRPLRLQFSTMHPLGLQYLDCSSVVHPFGLQYRGNASIWIAVQ